jgi:LmbE family N-acetylglucosaminyl deacetylase
MKIYGQNLLVLAPHPDDEILGCGGLMLKVKENKGKVHVGLFTCEDSGNSAINRKSEFLQVMDYMKTDSYEILFSPKYHLKLDTIPLFDLIQAIEKLVDKIRPDIFAIPYASFNQDHKCVYEAAIAALRPAHGDRHIVNHVLVYEYPQIGWSLYEPSFIPNLYIDISNQIIEQKIYAFNLYKSQHKSDEYAISEKGIKALAQFRGKEISSAYAESFLLKRSILT